MKKVILSVGDFGSAIVRAVCIKEGMGRLFNPYKIIASSLRLADDASVEVCIEEQGETTNVFDDYRKPNAPRIIDESVIHFLTKTEILAELAIVVDVSKLGRKPCTSVQGITPEIPDSVSVRLRYMPMGSLIKDALPVFDGSLSV